MPQQQMMMFKRIPFIHPYLNLKEMLNDPKMIIVTKENAMNEAMNDEVQLAFC